jgi:hypothetical protein
MKYMWYIYERSKSGKRSFARTWRKCKYMRKRKYKSLKNEKKMKEILKKVHAQWLFWKPHCKTAICWAFLYDNKECDLIALQIMQYFLLQ